LTSTAIKIENLSKKYRLGDNHGYKTLRETLVRAVKAPFQRLSSTSGANTNAANIIDETEFIWALKDVSLEVERGDVVGIIGRNGAGKSTLLKILSKITEPTEGRIALRGRVGSLLEVGTGFHPELTGHENIYLYGAILGMDRWEVTRKFDEIVAFAELERFMDTPVKRYSSGMYMRLAFSVAAHLEPEILLVDEVLAVGDAAFQKKCLGKMGEVSKEGRTVVFVSHNMGAIQNLCNKAILIENGKNKKFGLVNDIVKVYQEEFLINNKYRQVPPNVIYDLGLERKKIRNDFEIIRIEIIDKEGNPKPIVSTWDEVKLRIIYHARCDVKVGSAVLKISTIYGTPLLLCSTQPDSTFQMEIKVGYNTVECEFVSFPFSAGNYIVGAGLAIPKREWLCWNEQLGLLTVHPKDVYHSGEAPMATRSIIATPHKWRIIE